jgi:hypothetical protein
MQMEPRSLDLDGLQQLMIGKCFPNMNSAGIQPWSPHRWRWTALPRDQMRDLKQSLIHEVHDQTVIRQVSIIVSSDGTNSPITICTDVRNSYCRRHRSVWDLPRLETKEAE